MDEQKLNPESISDTAGIRAIIEELLVIYESTYPRLFGEAVRRIQLLEANAYRKGWVDAMKQENVPDAKHET